MKATKLIDNSVIEFDWSLQIENRAAILTFCNEKILWEGGICMLTGPAGKGKSNIVLAALASVLNKNCDSLGFKFATDKRYIYIDTENEKNTFIRNVRNTLQKRALLIEGDEIKNVSFVCLGGVDKIEKKKKIVFSLLDSDDYDVYIIDTVTDLIKNVNDVNEVVDFITKLCSSLFNKKKSVFLTIHGNPLGEAREKARGVLGSELLRKASCSLLLKIDEEDRRCITTDFLLGKNRLGDDKLEQYFTKDEDLNIFVSCNDATPFSSKKSKEKEEKRIEKIIEIIGDEKIKSKELVDIIKNEFNISQRSAYYLLSKAVKEGKINKDKNDYYYTL